MELAMQALLFLAIAAVPALAANYDISWSSGVDYSSWASDKSIQPGDTVTFQYGGLHSVYEVGKADYDACTTSNSISSSSDGNTVITLDKPGTHYFVCGTIGHCSMGMKMAIPVSAASTTPSPSTPGGSTPATPTTSPSTPSTPSSPGKQSSSHSSAAIFQPVKALLMGTLLGLVALLR